jgi:CubicO group peptidase (beta-lactamase class C family)
VVWEKAYGPADIASGRPMRTDAIFRLFSTSRANPLTDPLERYLPAFKDVRVYMGTDASGRMTVKPPARKITLQDVFRHTAGFAYGGYFEDTPVDRAYRDAGIVYANPVMLLFTQYTPRDVRFDDEFQTLVYQALVNH